MSTTTSSKFSYKRFIQGELHQQNTLTLNHRRVFILPNKAGFAMLALIVLMLVASINYNNSMGFVFTFLLASAAQISTFYSFKNLSALEIIALRATPFHLGEEGAYSLSIKELEGRERWNIAITIGEISYPIQHIDGLASLTVPIPIKPNMRGWFDAKTITVSSTFPLGIFRAWAPLQFEQKVLVYPLPLSSEKNYPLRAETPTMDAQRVPRRASTILRDYVTISWASTIDILTGKLGLRKGAFM